MGEYEPHEGQFETGYFCELYSPDSGDNEFRVGKHIDVGYELIDSVTYNWQPDNYYYMRLNITDNVIKAKVWEEGETEPDSWTIETTETKIIEDIDKFTSDFEEGTLTDVVAEDNKLILDKDSNDDYYSSGTRENPQIDLSDIGGIRESKIEWKENLNGQSIKIETSTDDGSTWTEVSNGDSIPDLNEDTTTLDVRQTLETTNSSETPELLELKVEITPFYWEEGIIGIGNFNKEGDRYYDFVGIGWLGNTAPKEDFEV